MSKLLTPWHIYTQEVLAWAVDSHIPAHSYMPDKHNQKNILRLLEHGQDRDWYIVLGCNNLSLDLSKALSTNKTAQILVIESDLNLTRAFLEQFAPLPPNLHLLADTSPWALYFLTSLMLKNGPKPYNSTIQWATPPKQRSKTLTTWRKLFLGCQAMPVIPRQSTSLKLSVGLIAHPNEAHLNNFFAQIPAWVHEVVVIWDGAIPDSTWNCATKVQHFSRDLNSDFAAQRNAMLDNCTGNWILYLDADERLTPQSWEQLLYLANQSDIGVYFPRMTFEGDEQHVRMGHGLWPDIQLRLFPLGENVHFVGSVHEKVAGLTCNFFLAPHIPILHYSHIYKNKQELRQRLATFSAAGHVEHKLSQAYPRLERIFFDTWTHQDVSQHIFQLPS